MFLRGREGFPLTLSPTVNIGTLYGYGYAKRNIVIIMMSRIANTSLTFSSYNFDVCWNTFCFTVVAIIEVGKKSSRSVHLRET